MVKRVLCREIEMKGCDGHATLRHCLKIRPGLLVVAEIIAVDEVAPPYAILLPKLHLVSIYSLAQRSQAKSGEFTPFAIRTVDAGDHQLRTLVQKTKRGHAHAIHRRAIGGKGPRAVRQFHLLGTQGRSHSDASRRACPVAIRSHYHNLTQGIQRLLQRKESRGMHAVIIGEQNPQRLRKTPDLRTGSAQARRTPSRTGRAVYEPTYSPCTSSTPARWRTSNSSEARQSPVMRRIPWREAKRLSMSTSSNSSRRSWISLTVRPPRRR